MTPKKIKYSWIWDAKKASTYISTSFFLKLIILHIAWPNQSTENSIVSEAIKWEPELSRAAIVAVEVE